MSDQHKMNNSVRWAGVWMITIGSLGLLTAAIALTHSHLAALVGLIVGAVFMVGGGGLLLKPQPE